MSYEDAVHMADFNDTPPLFCGMRKEIPFGMCTLSLYVVTD